MGLQYLIIGCFFLLNPYFSIIDLLPDFIGYIFILKGLSKVSKFSAGFQDAAKNFRYLLILSLARLATTPLIANTEEVWPLVVVLCFGLGELFLSFRGFHSLFDAFSTTANSPEAALYVRWKETRQFVYLFLVIKQAVCILPELCLLSSGDYGVVTPDGVQSLNSYRLPFILLGMILGLFVGIAWFVQIRRYLKNILKDQPYQEHLEMLYQTRYANVSAVFISDCLHRAITLLMAAMLLSLELTFDGVNYLPHLVSSIFLAIAAKGLFDLPGKASVPSGKRTAILALTYGIVSIPRLVYSIIFTRRIFGEYLDSELEGLQLAYFDVLQDYLARDFNTIYGFAALVILAVAEAVVMILLLRSFYTTLKEIIVTHTRASLPPPPPPEGLENYTPKKDDFTLNLNRPRVLSYGLGVIAAISMAVAAASPAFFPSFWLIDALLRAAWVVSGYYLLSKLRDEVDSHYTFMSREEDLHELTR